MTYYQKPLFNGRLSERLKTEGIDKAADNNRDDLKLARGIAMRIANENGKVNADDVGRALKAIWGIETLGPAAGALFRGKQWEFTGEWVKSKRVSNHSRMIRVWRLRA